MYCIFLVVKAFTPELKSFFEICRGDSNIIRFVDSLLFLVCQYDTTVILNLFSKRPKLIKKIKYVKCCIIVYSF